MTECEIIIHDFDNSYRYSIRIYLNYIQFKSILKHLDLDQYINTKFAAMWIHLSFDSINFPKLLLSLTKYKITWVNEIGNRRIEFSDFKKLPLIRFYPYWRYSMQEYYPSMMLLNQSIFSIP